MKCNTGNKKAIKLNSAVKSIMIIILLALLSGQLSAESDGDYILASADVKQFIKEFPAIRSKLEAKKIYFNDDDSEYDKIADSKKLNEANKIVNKHGYTDFMDFNSKLVAIFMAYAAIKVDEEFSEGNSDIQKALLEIEDSDDYNAEQKAEVKQLSFPAQFLSNENNVRVVTPYRNQLAVLFEEYNEDKK